LGALHNWHGYVDFPPLITSLHLKLEVLRKPFARSMAIEAYASRLLRLRAFPLREALKI
jgi:hypothetical protein